MSESPTRPNPPLLPPRYLPSCLAYPPSRTKTTYLPTQQEHTALLSLYWTDCIPPFFYRARGEERAAVPFLLFLLHRPLPPPSVSYLSCNVKRQAQAEPKRSRRHLKAKGTPAAVHLPTYLPTHHRPPILYSCPPAQPSPAPRLRHHHFHFLLLTLSSGFPTPHFHLAEG
ncbi:hypothetical protein LX32DRAFT_385150 [Colletotrichum zoysiae]|uniref:Uncharacterized protein n=1 Tax=Colletotrichum zoysiae TaxID=1216348 RepID=A0AAD9M552_9PEZI|nr:hypothetical protein LX32DRAFT_385150 [Colletotrichum zoysiae]